VSIRTKATGAILLFLLVPSGAPTQEDHLRSPLEMVGSWELIEWHDEGQVFRVPQVGGYWSIQGGIVTWVVFRKTEHGEILLSGFGNYEADETQFRYGYERITTLELEGEHTSATTRSRPVYEYLPSVVGDLLVLNDESHAYSFVLEGDRLTYEVNGQPVRIYRRIR